MQAALDVANQRIGLDGVVRTTDGHTVLHPDGIAFWDEKQPFTAWQASLLVSMSSAAPQCGAGRVEGVDHGHQAHERAFEAAQVSGGFTTTKRWICYY